MAEYKLDWSDVLQPSRDCSYTHVKAPSPFGPIIIEWKGWKDYETAMCSLRFIEGGMLLFSDRYVSTFGYEEHNRGDTIHHQDVLDEFKIVVEKKLFEIIGKFLRDCRRE